VTSENPHGESGRRPNRLAKEKSPYLLQHAYNPVDWYPWGEEAFKKAKEENRPIFLSIGYSTCHWCHVMEKESFENEEIAAYLNANFVAIKVDREERPDVDAIYMSAVQAMGIHGGWPLNLFLTPDRTPFYGGTYFPPDDRYGRPGFMSVLKRIQDIWTNQRDRATDAGAQISEALRKQTGQTGMVVLGPDTLKSGYDQFKKSYDPVNGGFSSKPKFPRAHEIWFLLRQHRRHEDAEGLKMITHTLDAMANGGMYDHLGGGFHRYSTDERWLVPHFEKMLYDQAILARAYLEAYQVTGRERYARVAREIFAYVLRDLRDPKGGFHSAEDADSEGEEGTFYVWRPEEIQQLLGPKPARAFNAYYGVAEPGNFERGTSILHVTRSEDEVAKELGISAVELRKILVEGREKLFQVRARRVRPHLDDKVLTDWNGLMISSFAFGGAVLDEPEYVRAASEAAEFILGTLQRGGRLLHRYREGEPKGLAFLDDYAFFGMGLLDLYEASFDPRWLKESKRLANEAVRLFRDESDGAFMLVGRDGEELITVTKEIYDGAIPSGNSVAATWFLRLGQMTVDKDLQARGMEILRSFSGRVERYPAGYPYFMVALDFSVGPTREIVIAGEAGAEATKKMLRAVRQRYMPDAVLILHEPGEKGKAIQDIVPFVKGQVQQEGRTTAYVCRNYACELPTTELGRFEQLLSGEVSKPAS
jgi:uncharacterized protein YyaL (SSP411 family)